MNGRYLEFTFGPTVEIPIEVFTIVPILHQRHRRWAETRAIVRRALASEKNPFSGMTDFEIWVHGGYMRKGVSFRQMMIDFEHWEATYPNLFPQWGTKRP